MIEQQTVIATPNPGVGALSGATGISVLVGYGASLLGAHLGLPPEVTMAILTGVTTILTSLWHRFFGPAVPVVVPKQPQ